MARLSLTVGPVDQVASTQPGPGDGLGGLHPRGRFPSRLPEAMLALATVLPLPLLGLLVLGGLDELLGKACKAGTFGVLGLRSIFCPGGWSCLGPMDAQFS